ncbi:hypothetical protein AN216_07710 [Streptomyces oceani]|uniref:FAD-dependent urate hydroxylase HpyO/Asp monooxygenase CreE-like FAD/NAD(P)-binding domain-containing protein n=1 Tax=Streptomyces oceani TaxID=1075402 RepID=A0A1E7KJM3_9ACTN|nr:hypothetical protein AN216_07710 [Streptomyces oceani]
MAVVGAGAAGTLVAVQVCETALRRARPLDLVLIDPAPEAGRGAAYATRDPEHRLNVPAGGMSCYPEDPEHFLRWLCRHGRPEVSAGDFVSRYRYGSYLADTLGRAVIAAHGTVSVRRLRVAVDGCAWPSDGRARLRLADGRTVSADSVVLATGPAPGGGWIPEELREAPGFVARPWAPGALDALAEADGDVLLVGSGLTAVDLALSLQRVDRTVHSASRNGLLPQSHTTSPQPPLPPPPELAEGMPLDRLRTVVRRHLAAAVREHGDWRPAMDGLRPVTARMWQGLSERDRAVAISRDATRWNVHRHRMAPATAQAVDQARSTGRLRLHTGRLASVRPLEDGRFDAVLASGSRLTVRWVVDCTGPGDRLDASGDPLWSGLLSEGLAVAGPLGMGVATERGRLCDADGDTSRPLYTLGAPRQGELWETTAMPEIRVQAAELAADLVPAAP